MEQKCITIGMFQIFGYLHEVCDRDHAIVQVQKFNGTRAILKTADYDTGSCKLYELKHHFDYTSRSVCVTDQTVQ